MKRFGTLRAGGLKRFDWMTIEIIFESNLSLPIENGESSDFLWKTGNQFLLYLPLFHNWLPKLHFQISDFRVEIL